MVFGLNPKRRRLLDLLYSRSPWLRGAPVVNDINPDEFDGPVLVVVPVVPSWADAAAPTGGKPYTAAIHAYIRGAGLSSERFAPTQEECRKHRLTPGETVFIVTRPA